MTEEEKEEHELDFGEEQEEQEKEKKDGIKVAQNLPKLGFFQKLILGF